MTKEEWIADVAVKLISTISTEYVATGLNGCKIEQKHIYAARIAQEMADVIFKENCYE